MAVTDLMMAEYGWGIHRTLYGTPATVIFALIPAISERNGGESGPAHADHVAGRARKAREAELRATYKIVPNPPREKR